jgi:hypothetical protein
MLTQQLAVKTDMNLTELIAFLKTDLIGAELLVSQALSG